MAVSLDREYAALLAEVRPWRSASRLGERAEQHEHPWFDRLDVDALDLGVGNRFGGADATRP